MAKWLGDSREQVEYYGKTTRLRRLRYSPVAFGQQPAHTASWCNGDALRGCSAQKTSKRCQASQQISQQSSRREQESETRQCGLGVDAGFDPTSRRCRSSRRLQTCFPLSAYSRAPTLKQLLHRHATYVKIGVHMYLNRCPSNDIVHLYTSVSLRLPCQTSSYTHNLLLHR